MDKTKLLDILHETREQFDTLISGVDDEVITQPGVIGSWSIKDILDHISRWEAELVKLLWQTHQGKKPTTYHFVSNLNVDDINARWYLEGQARSLSDVLEDFENVRMQTIKRVETFTDRELTDPKHYAWLAGKPLWEWIAGDSFDHEKEHAEQIKIWLDKSMKRDEGKGQIMESKLKELKDRLLEYVDLGAAGNLLSWDQSTYMPPGGTQARARQTALLGQLAQEKFTNPAIGKLLDELTPYEQSMPYESDEASLIRVTRREYERQVKIPPALIGEVFGNGANSYQAWMQARPANDFAAVVPYLEKTLELSRKVADCFPGYEHIADPLIDMADYGMTASSLQALFSDLRDQLLPIVQAITSQPPTDDACLKQHFPEKEQLAFSEQVARDIGYDFQRGRLDKTPHPFTTKFSVGDVRITTRVRENFLGEALFSTIHEAGHGMYEQGIDMKYEGTPLANGTSSGVHESQSRLWENVVARSLGFWKYYYPKLQGIFPEQLRNVSLDTFYRSINKVERSLIRTDADEVTYNLHIMMRFDFELAMLEGKLAVRDLAEAWQERSLSDLGIVSPDDRDGVLQDVHWFAGLIGGDFQGYTIGNILGAQFYDCALKQHPEIPTEIENGKFDTLLGWLKENIYQHGAKFTAPELVERVTGGPISIEPYMRYLKTKYDQLYKL